MATYNVSLPFIYFADPTKGRPVFNGSIYVGEVDKDPELFPIQVYIQNQNGTISAVTQPIKTGAGGVPLVNGSPAQLVVQDNYSMRVRDSVGSQVYYVSNGLANTSGGGGGGGDDSYVPLAGTVSGLPITGKFQYKTTGITNSYETGIFGAPFNGYWIADNIGSATARVGVQVNGKLWTFEPNGGLYLGTDFSTPGLNTASAASMQYVLDQIGSPLGNFIPLAGTAPNKEVTGPIEFSNANLGLDYTIGILEGLTDEFTLSGGPMLIATGAQATTQWFAFNSNGTLQLPDIDYSAVGPLNAVNKAYVDANGGGGGGAFIPLAGTVTGQEVTGLIKFKDIALNQEWQLGITNFPGVWQNMSISNGGGGTLPTSFAFIINGKYFTFDSDGLFTTVDANVLGSLTADGILTNGIIDSGGATFGGNVTISTGGLTIQAGNLNAKGVLCDSIVSAGLINNGNLSSTTITINTTGTPAQANMATRRDYVDGQIGTCIRTTGTQTKSGVLSMTSSQGLALPGVSQSSNQLLGVGASAFGSYVFAAGPATLLAEIPVAQAAIQDAQTLIDVARERIESLEAERDAMIQRFEAVEARVLALEGVVNP